ncbi:MAG: hypothetical protein JWM27_3749 [Gemmatimonadetes bacterium]|nr:hypothetical protein [Gemmatimonadota bacterium]
MPLEPLRSPAHVRATLPVKLAGWAAVLALAFGAAPAAGQGVLAPAPDTLRFTNTASLAYTGEDGVDGSSTSSVSLVLEQQAGVALAPPREAVVVPGSRRAFAHVLTNAGTGRDAFALSASSAQGWAAALWKDVDGDGALGPNDVLVAGPLALAKGQTAALLVVVDVPAGAADRAQVSVQVKAVSALNGAAEMTVEDRLTVHLPVAAMALRKTVDRPWATTGDTLTYTLSWANGGDGPSGDAALDDALPRGLRYVPGSLSLDGRALTDTADADAGQVLRDAALHETVRVKVGPVAPGDSGRATFRAVLPAGTPAGAVANVATLAWDTVSLESPTATTTVKYPTLQVRKERIGADTVTVGGEIVFRLGYGNLSTDVAVRDATLTDSLPTLLTFVSADVAPEVEGQVLRWHLGDLAPGASGTITVHTRAGNPGLDGVASVINRVVARGANAEAVSAAAAALQVTAFKGDELRVTKAAGVLEAGAGDVVPFTITLRNEGFEALRGIELADRLPEGVRLVPGSLAGADSMRAAGRDLRIWWSGPLAGRSQQAVRYAVTVIAAPRTGSLVNTAWAWAEHGLVRSDTAVARVSARRGFAMQQRAIVGKVWLDNDDDGRQDEGEPGVAGMEVWSADGQVVTTDRQGRFSFRDVTPGTQLLRLDTLGAPRGYTVAGRDGDQRMVRMDGWTLPQASFRLVPRGGVVPVAESGVVRMSLPAPTTAVDAGPVERMDAAVPTGFASIPLPPLDAAPSAKASVDEALASCPIGGPVASVELARSLVTASRAAPRTPPVRVAPGGGPSAPPAPVPAAANGSTEPAVPSVMTGAATASALPAKAAADTTGPRVAPLRSAEDRAAEVRGEFSTGPSVRIVAPADGAVVGSNRLYVGVRGEPGAAVKVFDGARQVGEATLRPDGAMDFVNVELAPGPHRLRVWMQSSWGRERWDSVAVHRSGEPARIEALGEVQVMHADARDTVRVAARVLDRWNVPVADRPKLTVESRGVSAAAMDADASSVGLQVAVGADGTVTVPMTAGHEVGPGTLALSTGKVRQQVALRVFPSTRALIATGVGQVGVGAAPASFGAVTVRGAVGGETSLSVSYDSRRGQNQDDFFGRGYDPLDESRYPTFGDGSERRVLSASTQALSARLERGFNWLELGDIRTTGFGGGDQLGGYQRSLTGVGGRVATGPVVWRAFGSLTDQALAQRQIRGDGTSGPYRIGGSVRPGTDRVSVEIRARDNAARVIGTQLLQRFVDYQIDYGTGEILLERPVPAADAEGNPVYVVATVERRSGGKSQLVGGLRMEVDARRWLSSAKLDSLGVGVYGVHDAAENGGVNVRRELLGGDVRLRRAGLEVGGELLRSATGDSAALAGHADASWTAPRDRAKLSAQWMRVGAGFSGSADPRLSSGLQEIRLAAEVKVAEGSRLELSHQRERFDQFGVQRQNTRLQLQQTVMGRTMTAEGGMATDVQADASSSSAVAKVAFSPMDRVDVWMEGTRNLQTAAPGQPAPSRPNQVGAGVALRLLPRTKLEMSHRWVSQQGDSAVHYQLTSLNLRTEAFLGGQVWGGLERTQDGRSDHYVALGWDQHLQLAGGWALSSMFERRFGVSSASLADPARALPFAQAEPDRWSAGLGMDWLPADGRPRVSAHGEVHDGRDTRGHRIDVAGDAPLGLSVAVLGRSEWLQEYHLTGSGLEQSRRDRSLLGLAFRPVWSDAVNVLAKAEWRRTLNPIGTSGVLGAAGQDARLIGSGDVVWTPGLHGEVAVRYALRWTLSDPSLPGVASLGARTQFGGLRVEHDLRGPLRARLDARVMTVGTGNPSEWSGSPSLVLRVARQLDVEGGYRFGNLFDPDFGNGGHGFFATLGFHFTEGSLGDAAAFWRQRIAHSQ